MLFGIRLFDCKNSTCPDSAFYGDTSGQTPGTTIAGTINGQATLPYADSSLGLGSYGTSGCGLIAIYNAMQLIGQPISMQDVEDEVLGEMVAFGAAGIAPWTLDNYFTDHNIAYTQVYHPATLCNNVAEGSVFVFIVMNNQNNFSAGLHVMAGQYTNGEYQIYNRDNHSTNYAGYSSLEEGFPKEAWVYGILIG